MSPTLLYRIDTGVNPTPTYTAVPMLDNGKGGDAVPGDGIYSATIPAQAAGTIAAFIVQARDSLGTTNVFPSNLHDNSGLPRECVVMFGDTIPPGSFGHYHHWLTQNWINRWSNLPPLSNEDNDGTWVDGGGRIIYNMGGRYAGSPYHQGYNSPVGTSATSARPCRTMTHFWAPLPSTRSMRPATARATTPLSSVSRPLIGWRGGLGCPGITAATWPSSWTGTGAAP